MKLFPAMTIKRCRFTCALVLALLAVGSTAGVLARVAKPGSLGLPNFHQVTGSVYRGGAPTEDGLKLLKTMKIHTIIDLRISPKMVNGEKKFAESMGFTWLNIPMGKDAPTQKQVDAFLSVLAKAPKEPVFVHCQHGADRTGCMIGIFRVRAQRRSFPQAWTEMREYGFKPHLSALKEAVRSRAKTVLKS